MRVVLEVVVRPVAVLQVTEHAVAVIVSLLCCCDVEQEQNVSRHVGCRVAKLRDLRV